MNKSEAYQAMEKGNKITHRFFIDNEYLHMVKGIARSEEGYNFEEWWEDEVEWKQDGYSIKKESVNND